jgi:hypothetical protein
MEDKLRLLAIKRLGKGNDLTYFPKDLINMYIKILKNLELTEQEIDEELNNG